MSKESERQPRLIRRNQVWVECTPVGAVRLLQSSSGGDPYGLPLAVDLVAGALGWLWRLAVGRGRWRVVVTDRATNPVLFSQVYRTRRLAQHDGMADVERMLSS